MNDPWRSRIVGHGEESPGHLIANPRNWRIHPKRQQDALNGVLSEVGWVQSIIVNKRTGFVVDGHARVEIAVSRGEPSVPVVYVDLDETEECVVLAAMDPIGAMAGRDAEKWDALLAEIAVKDADLQAMLAPATPTVLAIPQFYQVLTECADENVQRQLYERLREEGYTCRLLTL